MRKITSVSLGLLAFTALAWSAMPTGQAAAQALVLRGPAPAPACTLEACLEDAQQTYACCKDPGADGCEETLAPALGAPRKTCAQIFLSDVTACPGEVLTCELEHLRGRGPVLAPVGGGLKK